MSHAGNYMASRVSRDALFALTKKPTPEQDAFGKVCFVAVVAVLVGVLIMNNVPSLSR